MFSRSVPLRQQFFGRKVRFLRVLRVFRGHLSARASCSNCDQLDGVKATGLKLPFSKTARVLNESLHLALRRSEHGVVTFEKGETRIQGLRDVPQIAGRSRNRPTGSWR